MAGSKSGSKNKDTPKAIAYFALKSKNEIYYQMASIFKAVATDENQMGKKILSRLLTKNHSEKALENFL
jgi:hypothetical protein